MRTAAHPPTAAIFAAVLVAGNTIARRSNDLLLCFASVSPALYRSAYL
jgi:hypothetical protein